MADSSSNRELRIDSSQMSPMISFRCVQWIWGEKLETWTSTIYIHLQMIHDDNVIVNVLSYLCSFFPRVLKKDESQEIFRAFSPQLSGQQNRSTAEGDSLEPDLIWWDLMGFDVTSPNLVELYRWEKTHLSTITGWWFGCHVLFSHILGC